LTEIFPAAVMKIRYQTKNCRRISLEIVAVQKTLQFLMDYGYAVIAAWVFLEQAGLPVPALPLLLAAGALAGAGKLNAALVLLVAVIAALAGDLIWYWLGRTRGSRVLSFLCRISLEPDSCVRQSETFFSRNGSRTLMFAKFIPGLSALSTPMAGILKMPLGRFIMYDGFGATLWAGSGVGFGLIFSDQLERLVEYLSRFGSLLGIFVAAVFIAYIAWKFNQRRQFLKSLRMARITPEELKDKLDAGETVAIIDLRHEATFLSDPRTLPGALRMSPEEVEDRHPEIPRDREIVLYCT
jgi:membrane protein DedA with SNARE-associated domain